MLHYELDRSPRGRLGMHFEMADISATDTVFLKKTHTAILKNYICRKI